MIKLLFVVFHEKEKRIEAAVEDKTGRRRLVNFAWRTKDPTPITGHWMQAVEAELDNQDAEALAKAEGRQLLTGPRFPMASPPKRTP
jgi:hypothetical protein